MSMVEEQVQKETVDTNSYINKIGIVIIGRNEGERLNRCLLSVYPYLNRCIYVDSGSTDGSPEKARSLGFMVHELDMSTPPSAARARNEGFYQLLQSLPHLQYIQFLDGDCELIPGWFNHAYRALEKKSHVAMVAGRMYEKNETKSIYHRLYGMEWRRAIGEVNTCGGVFFIRRHVFRDLGGFNPNVIAAEDDELCIRMRRKGWKVEVLDTDMAIHDGGVEYFMQWWIRSIRSGYAFAKGASMYGIHQEKHFMHECRSIWVWGIILPLVILLGSLFISLWFLMLLCLYILLTVKIVLSKLSKGWNFSDSILYGIACVVAKIPHAIGLLKFHLDSVQGKSGAIIEFKGHNEKK